LIYTELIIFSEFNRQLSVLTKNYKKKLQIHMYFWRWFSHHQN